MVLGDAQAIAGRGGQVDGEFARHGGGVVGGEGLLGQVRDGGGPARSGSALFAAVVDDGGGEGAGQGPEDEPVARGEFAWEGGEAHHSQGGVLGRFWGLGRGRCSRRRLCWSISLDCSIKSSMVVMCEQICLEKDLRVALLRKLVEVLVQPFWLGGGKEPEFVSEDWRDKRERERVGERVLNERMSVRSPKCVK